MADLRELVEAVRMLDEEHEATKGAAHLPDDSSGQCPACRHNVLWQYQQDARVAVAEYLLTHPEAVEAYEAVLAYGLARKAAHGGEEMTEEQWRASLEDRAAKHREIFALADRLAAKGGE